MLLGGRSEQVRAHALVAGGGLTKVVGCVHVLLLRMLLLERVPGLLVEVRPHARSWHSRRSPSIPKIGVDLLVGRLVLHDQVGHHSKRLLSSHHRAVEARRRCLRVCATGSVGHVADRQVAELWATGAVYLKGPGVAEIGRMRELRDLRSGCERSGRRRVAHAAVVALWAVEAVRGRRYVARGGARPARDFEAVVSRARRSGHGRSTEGRAGILCWLLHRKAERRNRVLFFQLQVGEIVVLETLRESSTALWWQTTSIHRDRVAQDGGSATNACVRAFGISMVATRMLGKRGLAAEGLAAAWHEALVGASAGMYPPVACK